ncbi:ABC transporter substrate-binding protein [Halorubellus litoreus]|uniref:ABC transporter substrate-binding protein n=1 Tax=Halorubellus litoreus TaxID=755308 RepID=A0ABD5VGH1_9EURY
MRESSSRSTARTRRGFLALAGTGALGATAGCLDISGVRNALTGDTSGREEYTVGMIQSESGSLAAFGRRNERGLRNALTAINAVGIGEGSDPLVVELENDDSTPAGGVDAAERLVDQVEVPLLVGSIGSGVTQAIHEDVVSGSDVVQISQHSTSAALSELSALNRTAPSGTALGAALANLVADGDYESVAVTSIENGYGNSLSSVFRSAYDGEIAYEGTHPQGGESFVDELEAMRASGADAWLFVTYGSEFATMVTEAYERGYHQEVDYFGAESTLAESVLANTPEGSQESLVGVTQSAPVEQESYQRFSDEFRSIWGQDPSVWAAYSYDAVTLAAIAIEAAESFTGPAISDVVRDVTRPEGETVFSFEEAKRVLQNGGTAADVNYEGVSGPLDLDENGDPQGFYQVFEVEDHQYEFTDFITG